jgi:hypothetical protein
MVQGRTIPTTKNHLHVRILLYPFKFPGDCSDENFYFMFTALHKTRNPMALLSFSAE